MEILRVATRILSYIGISRSNEVLIGGRHIPIALIRWFFIASNLFNIAMEIVICVRFYGSGGARAILVPSHLAMAFSMAFSIYVNLLRRHDQIIELIEHLQRVIVASAYASSPALTINQTIDTIQVLCISHFFRMPAKDRRDRLKRPPFMPNVTHPMRKSRKSPFRTRGWLW